MDGKKITEEYSGIVCLCGVRAVVMAAFLHLLDEKSLNLLGFKTGRQVPTHIKTHKVTKYTRNWVI